MAFIWRFYGFFIDWTKKRIHLQLKEILKIKKHSFNLVKSSLKSKPLWVTQYLVLIQILILRIFYSHFFLFLEIYKLFYYYFKWQLHKGLYMKYFKLIVNLLLYHHRTTLYTCFYRSTPKTLKTLYLTSEYLVLIQNWSWFKAIKILHTSKQNIFSNNVFINCKV